MTAPTIHLAIDMRDPEQVGRFHAAWRLSDADVAAIRARAEFDAKRNRIIRDFGVAAVVAWQMTGVDPERSVSQAQSEGVGQ